jgi:hypothetical protein
MKAIGLHKPELIGSTVHCSLFIVHIREILCKPGGLDVETNRDRDRERP